MNPIIETIVLIGIFAMSVVLHEYAHGFVAFKLGDPTAKYLGRLTINPIKHIDPLGTIVLPLTLILIHAPFIIGSAKPVPVNFHLLKNPKRDMVLVAMAGPLVNISLAYLASLVLRNADLDFPILNILHFAVFVNLLLAVFNMMPVPPLDGSRLVSSLLPDKIANYYNRLEPFGILIVIVLLYFGVMSKIVFPIIQWIGQLWGITF